jgi:acyl-CoA thioesterase-1
MRAIVAVIATVSACLMIWTVLRHWPGRRRPRFPARIEGKSLVICAGDSLTEGTISGNYVVEVQARFPECQFFNAGINGDTSAGLLKRIDECVACNPNKALILIGTNDVRKSDDLASYSRNLDSIIGRLRNTHVAILSIPPLGEDLDGDINRRVVRWNTAVREIAARYMVTYLPLFETIAAELTRPGKPFKLRMGLMIAAHFRRSLLHQSFDEIAAINGFTIQTDQIHLSDRGAKIIATLVASWLTCDSIPCPQSLTSMENAHP